MGSPTLFLSSTFSEVKNDQNFVTTEATIDETVAETACFTIAENITWWQIFKNKKNLLFFWNLITLSPLMKNLYGAPILRSFHAVWSQVAANHMKSDAINSKKTGDRMSKAFCLPIAFIRRQSKDFQNAIKKFCRFVNVFLFVFHAWTAYGHWNELDCIVGWKNFIHVNLQFSLWQSRCD